MQVMLRNLWHCDRLYFDNIVHDMVMLYITLFIHEFIGSGQATLCIVKHRTCVVFCCYAVTIGYQVDISCNVVSPNG